MQAISGYLVPKDSYGKNNEFVLRTVTGKVRFSALEALPPMREGDMITVVVSGNAICGIADLSTGAEFRYRPTPPYLPEKISWSALILLNAAIGLLPLLGYLMAKLAPENVAGDIIVPWLGGWIGIGCFLWRRTIVNNVNVAVSNRVQEAVKRSLLDTSLWDIPERVEGEEQNW